MNSFSLRLSRAVRRLERAVAAVIAAKDKTADEQRFVLDQLRRARLNYQRIRKDVDTILDAAVKETANA